MHDFLDLHGREHIYPREIENVLFEHPVPSAPVLCRRLVRQAALRTGASVVLPPGVHRASGRPPSPLQRIRDEGLPLPAAAVLLSPRAEARETVDEMVRFPDERLARA